MKTTTPTSCSNQTGFSLVQGLVLTAIVSAAAIIGTNQIQDQKSVQKKSQTKSEISSVHDAIYSTLQNREHCTETLNALTPAINTDQLPRNLDAVSTSGGNALFSVNPGDVKDVTKIYMNGNVLIKEMKLAKIPAIDNEIDLIIDYESTKNNTPGASTRRGERNKIQLKIQKDLSTSEFLSCYAVKKYDQDDPNNEKMGNTNTFEDFCQSLGNFASWDEAGQVCKLNNNTCRDQRKLFVGIDDTGTPICKTIFEHANFSDFIDTTSALCNPASATRVGFVEVGGKVKMECGSVPYSPPINDINLDNQQCPNLIPNNGSCGAPVTGGWTVPKDPEDFSACTTGPNPTKSATRKCTNPTPKCSGAYCVGDEVVTVKCNCIPDKSCAQKRAETPVGQDAGNSSCDEPCGMGESQTNGCANPKDGVWSSTYTWGNCNNSSRTGKKTCEYPDPSCKGKPCVPDSTSEITEKCSSNDGPIIGSLLVKCGSTETWWTKTLLQSGEKFWSGGQICYTSGGPIREDQKPAGALETAGSKEACNCNGGVHQQGN